MFNTVQEAITWIEVQVKFKPKTDLIRMGEAYKMLGVDLSGIKKIHVAGTNGKGSVCSYLSHILLKAGYKVGTFTSPYLVRFHERIRFNMNEISDDELLELINIIYSFNESFAKTYGEHLSFFELLTLMSFLYFKHKEVDVMIMEVGLGGLLDATNILTYDLPLIVSIGFDHMKQLGNTLESIAMNKLGIVKEGNHLITTVDPSLHEYFKKSIEEKKATAEYLTLHDVKVLNDNPLVIEYLGETYPISLKGSYQVLNALLSIRAIHYLFPEIKNDIIRKGLSSTLWQGRLEEMDYHVYIDGAHNTHAMDALIETAHSTFKDKKIWVLFSALGDKDIPGMLTKIKTFAEKIVVTSFPDPRFIDLIPLIGDLPYVQNPMNAIHTLMQQMSDDHLLIITGSLHFIGYIKKNYKRTC
jgi:dihydrofolate synthase/folylpolyglutamate synthase